MSCLTLSTTFGDVPATTELVTTPKTDFTRTPAGEINNLLEDDPPLRQHPPNADKVIERWICDASCQPLHELRLASMQRRSLWLSSPVTACAGDRGKKISRHGRFPPGYAAPVTRRSKLTWIFAQPILAAGKSAPGLKTCLRTFCWRLGLSINTNITCPTPVMRTHSTKSIKRNFGITT